MAVLVTLGMSAGILAAVVALIQYRRQSPDVLATMQRTLNRQQVRLSMQDDRQDAMELEIADLREALASNHEETRELRDGIGILVAQIRAAGMTPLWTPETVVRRPRLNGAKLARVIDARFSVSEIDGLAFEFGMAADEMSGDTRAARARALVTWARDHDRLAELQRRVGELRPGAM